jgi:hypothetical protein
VKRDLPLVMHHGLVNPRISKELLHNFNTMYSLTGKSGEVMENCGKQFAN